MDSDNHLPPSPDPESENPLQFWVAYIPGAGDTKNYLSDGKGNLRVFKSEQALRDFIRPQLRPEVYEMVVVHPVQGQIAIPDDGSVTTETRITHSPGEILPLDMQNLKPITTLALPTPPPSVEELLQSHVQRKRRRRRN